MKKAALYSSSGRSRRPGSVSTGSDAAAGAAPPDAPAPAPPPGRLRAFLRRQERSILVLAGALFAVALAAVVLATRPATREYTQRDIDAAVAHTLENNPLPSFATAAYEAVRPSVVRVIGIGPEEPDEADAEKGAKGKGAGKGEKGNDKNADKGADKDSGKGGKETGKQARRGSFKSPDELAPKTPPADPAKPGPNSAEAGKDGERPSRGSGVGTGVVIIDKGVILTNLHVVIGAERIKVRFDDGTESEATLIGARPEHDLAVLQAKTIPDDLVAATLRSTADLAIGDQVVAVGYPFGIGPSASSGVVSGLKREYHSPEGKRILTNLIQFDAAANPGNSGGPLVTAGGEVVGIVTGILNPTEQRVFIGIGFAVPIENAASAAGMSPF
jgi:S1-C subfamily serine protease